MIFAAFAAILAALLIGGTLAAAPIRRKMVVLANELHDGPGSTDRLKDRVDFFLDSAASPWVAILMVVAAVVSLIDALVFDSEEPHDQFLDDVRYEKLLGFYLASIALANPLVTIIFLPFVLVCMLIHGCIKAVKGAHLADAQIERVAHSRLSRA